VTGAAEKINQMHERKKTVADIKHGAELPTTACWGWPGKVPKEKISLLEKLSLVVHNNLAQIQTLAVHVTSAEGPWRIN
jgi:hypothetical protein